MSRAARSSAPPSPTASEASGFAACARAFVEELDHVHRALRRMGVSPAEAEDLAQDVFVVLWRRWGDLQADRPLRPWLTGIAQRVAMDHFRRGRRQVAWAGLDPLDAAPGPDEQLETARARALALEALGRLTEAHRRMIIRYYLDGVSIQEIADEEALPFFTASARLRRARLRFTRAIHKLQRARGLAALTPELVLGSERSVPPAPAAARARLEARLAQGPGGLPPVRPLPGRAAPGIGPLPLVAALVLVVALAVLLALRLGGGGRAPDHGRQAAARSGASPPRGRPQLPPARVPPPRLQPAPPELPIEPRPLQDTLARGLVGHWPLDEEAGSPVARDASGQGRTCLLHDRDPADAWVKGVAGGAIDLGGEGWLECPLPEARGGQPLELSVAVWVKRNRPQPGRHQALFTRQLPTGDAGHLYWFGLLGDSVRVWSRAWTGWATGGVPTLDQWTHLAFVHKHPSTRLYVDGVLVRNKTGTRPRGPRAPVTSSLTIGAARFRLDPTSVRNRFDGQLDEARAYDRALTDAEIAALASLR